MKDLFSSVVALESQFHYLALVVVLEGFSDLFTVTSASRMERTRPIADEHLHGACARIRASFASARCPEIGVAMMPFDE